MKPVDQKEVAQGTGDCLRATVASLLELPLECVPHFRIMDDKKWFSAFVDYLMDHGYEFHGTGYPDVPSLQECPNVDGYVIASVLSRTFAGVTHSVIVDMDFQVVHDPNPNKAWQGDMVTRRVRNWWMISRVRGE